MPAEAQFEAAADAVVNGDSETLTRLLRANPELARARSHRSHRATLLHYAAANGVEAERQKTPPNIVAIAELILKAGAEVDAIADIYGGSTTLGLAATSVPPQKAGVQIALMEKLLDYGASLAPEIHSAPHRKPSLINACLANGRLQAAEFLAQRGAPVDLESAAGLGRLDLLPDFFDARGNLKDPAEQESLQRGFFWAAEYGQTAVLEFLLERGADLAAADANGQTALHWAVIGGSVEATRLLLRHGAPLEARNSFGGTALGQALWSAAHGADPQSNEEIVKLLTQSGAISTEISLEE